MSTVTAPIAPARSTGKYALWTILGLAGFSVLFSTEYPLLIHTSDPYRAELIRQRFFIVPHAVFALTAMLIGPFQFSTRFRQRHLARHRLMGKVYVICIAITAPIAIALGFRSAALSGYPMAIANTFMAACWFLCTFAAFLTARNRHITAHRQWMVKSYCFTLNFIFTRVLNFWPAYANLSNAGFADVLWGLTIAYLLLPDLYFNWRELTTSRAKTA